MSIASSEKARHCTIGHRILRLPDRQHSNGNLVGQLEDQDLSRIDCHPIFETLPTVGQDREDGIPC